MKAQRGGVMKLHYRVVAGRPGGGACAPAGSPALTRRGVRNIDPRPAPTQARAFTQTQPHPGAFGQGPACLLLPLNLARRIDALRLFSSLVRIENQLYRSWMSIELFRGVPSNDKSLKSKIPLPSLVYFFSHYF